jgi:hypothetical protein
MFSCLKNNAGTQKRKEKTNKFSQREYREKGWLPSPACLLGLSPQLHAAFIHKGKCYLSDLVSCFVHSLGFL